MATEDKLSSSDGKMPVILDGTFFTIVNVDGDKVLAKCLKCPGNETFEKLLLLRQNAHLLKQ